MIKVPLQSQRGLFYFREQASYWFHVSRTIFLFREHRPKIGDIDTAVIEKKTGPQKTARTPTYSHSRLQEMAFPDFGKKETQPERRKLTIRYT